jgi:hypothetical protein
MDRPCHHHPDREAAGTCCYCDRPLCGECLLTNRQEKSFCRREDDCLAYQDELSSPGEPASPIVDYLIDEFSLDAQVKRISEILEELEELKGLLDDLEGAGPAHPLEVDPRIPGFCAYKLTEEAVALLGLISLRVEFIRKEQELSGRSVLLERANAVQGFLEQEAGPKIREYRDFAKEYGNLDVSRLVESIGTQDQEQES